MNIHFASDEKIAETSSKGNQEKWYNKEAEKWYKVDQFGYEALSETVISELLELSNIESETEFKFVRYQMERVNVHGHDRTACISLDFLKEGQSIVTLAHLLGKQLGGSLKEHLLNLPSDKQRIKYIAEMTADITELEHFPQYLTLLFEIDSLFLNDDRHLNNIAVLEKNGKYEYCPIFDNGAALLSNTQIARMDISPKALITSLRARPFNMSFTRQMNTARNLYGRQLKMPVLDKKYISELLEQKLMYYPARDRAIISERVEECILTRQKLL